MSDSIRKNPLVSIIVAVYNAEKYLSRCIDSILKQTFTDWECLLIDDGSPDNSGKMCDEYARQDSRFKVIHKPNGGVGSARKCGIDNACGEYTIHIDPDDWVEPDMLAELYSKAVETNADMVICDFFSFRKGKNTYSSQKPSALDAASVRRDLQLSLCGAPWNKFVRLNCYKKYNINFPQDMNYGEDNITIINILSNPINVSYLPKAFYHYDQSINPLSICNLFSKENYLKKEYYIMKLMEGINETDMESFIKSGRYVHGAYFALKLGIYTKTEFHEKYNYLLKINILSISELPFHGRLVIWSAFHFSYRLSVFFAKVIHKYNYLKNKLIYG